MYVMCSGGDRRQISRRLFGPENASHQGFWNGSFVLGFAVTQTDLQAVNFRLAITIVGQI